MWTYVEAVRLVLRRSFRAILAVAAFAMMTPMPSDAAPVEYTKICSLYGAGFFYIPGTDTCVNANTGQTKKATEHGVVEGVTQSEQDTLNAQEGVAIDLAMPGTVVDQGKHFGVSGHVGTFDGKSAVGLGGALRLNDNVTFDAGAGVGLDDGTVGARAGFNVSW